MIFTHFLFCVDLEISFEEPSYAIMEGETLRICAVITSGINAVPVSIDIDTADGTAQSKKVIIQSIKFEFMVLYIHRS